MSVNKVSSGRTFGQDPESRYMTNGELLLCYVGNLRKLERQKAERKQEKNPSGTILVFYRRLAEIAGEYLKKGSQVYVEGNCKPENGKPRKVRIAYHRDCGRRDTMAGRPIFRR